MSVRAVALAATPGVIGGHELCMGGKQVVESAQHEGAAFELELAHVWHCKSDVRAAVGQRCGILAISQDCCSRSNLSNNLGSTRPLEPLLRSYDSSQARERREGASPSFEFKCDKTGFAGSRGARADSVRPLRPSYMHPDAAVKGLFVVSIIAAVALLAYFRVPLGGCGASSALDDFAPPKRKKRVKHADD